MSAGLLSILAAVLLVGTPVARSGTSWPNDPAWPGEWGPVVTHTVDVWRHGTGSPDVVVAVVDTGVAAIADLEGALVPGVDLVGGGVGPGGPDELGYHGTWVASIIAARGNNGRDAVGYCWRCSIMPVRVSDGTAPASAALVAKGITWAVDHGADVVNVSLAGGDPSSAEESAVAYAAAHGVVVVGAAGNSGDETLHFPGAYRSVLAVAGSDENDRLYPWSTRGSWVPLSAPGCATVVDPLIGVAYGCGSSFAPAAVAGIAGLLFSFSPSLSADQVVAALRSSAHAVDGIGGGRVDAAAAYAALALPDVANAPPPAPPAVAPAAAAASREVTMRRGTLTRARAFTFGTGSGRVAVRFAARPGARCQVRLQLAGSVAVGLTDHGTVSLGGRVDVGTARVNVACRSLPLAYSLEIEHPAPPG